MFQQLLTHHHIETGIGIGQVLLGIALLDAPLIVSINVVFAPRIDIQPAQIETLGDTRSLQVQKSAPEPCADIEQFEFRLFGLVRQPLRQRLRY